jgi:ferrochelatase
MKISSIVDIVNAELQNSPAISFITQSHTNINKINDGDMFISSNKDEIIEAVNNGAFAIIYDIDLDISKLNNEIAYIKVTNINEAIIRLLRFELSNKKIKSIYCDDISYEIFNIYKDSSTTLCLGDDILQNYENINNKYDLDMLISTNKEFLTKIYPTSSEFKIVHYDLKNLIVHSLFETSFSFKDRYFYKLKLPMIYVDKFISIIEYLNINDVDVSRLKNFKYLKPIFINQSNQIVDYGRSNMFILANKNKNINYLEVAFLQKAYSYAKIKIIDDNITNNDQIFEELSKHDFNALYIKSKSYDDMISLLQENQQEQAQLF